tara:strand:- start:4827 stop:5846 length:1020 start_codon:yes stop_codon:yes gene_type:complete
MTEEVEFEIDSEVSQDSDDWSRISPNKVKEEEKIEYEVEEKPQEDQAPKQKGEATVEEEAGSDKEPDELNGINTRGAQKRIRQLIKQRKERDDALKLEKSRVAQLEAQLKASKADQVKSTKTNLDMSAKQLEEKAAIIKANMKRAVDDDDSDAIVNANEALGQTQAELMLLRQSQEAYKDIENVEQEAPVQQTAQQETHYDPKAVAWTTKNEWFGNDQLLTAAALAVDAQLKEEGYDPSDDEFYDEVDARLREQLPNKFTEGVVEEESPVVEPSKPKQVVAGTSRSPAPAASKKVRLSQEDVDLAQRWGIPLDRFAAQKLNAEQSDGEYTTINTTRGVQ